ncbi:PREDICTED: ribosome production factor 2 homolog [Amphimedon queenslandica]|uniref:Ribosome production factor 2 homolog n=1 Tax=Amphimedon queenslandica TaxID=400682 RepID=A0A1X7U306_AMPQE|nr:PREDICTED: ribosome production factor 2 homolog [Amphimedon queenslandica]|eukprot:XP_003389127.1 PREDICTED: ribosome production factor 2 homolog [Amphimedon queenslandica]
MDVVKPKNQRSKRALEKRAPKLIENPKTAMFVRGGHISQIVTDVMTDLCKLKRPNAVLYRKKNATRPFEDPTTIEFFSQKSDASLFMYGSHNKKRPHNIVFGRMFDHHLLDMIELGVEQYKPMSSFTSIKSSVGIKPCLIFSGDSFETEPNYAKLKNLLIDFFHGSDVERVDLSSLETVITFTVSDGKIFMRVYHIALKKSGTRTPRVELEEMGPSLDLVLRRTHIASSELFKLATRRPKALKPKKEKNISKDPFGSKLARIHMTRQDMKQLKTRRVKGLKRKRDTAQEEGEGTESSPKRQN